MVSFLRPITEVTQLVEVTYQSGNDQIDPVTFIKSKRMELNILAQWMFSLPIGPHQRVIIDTDHTYKVFDINDPEKSVNPGILFTSAWTINALVFYFSPLGFVLFAGLNLASKLYASCTYYNSEKLEGDSLTAMQEKLNQAMVRKRQDAVS